MNQTDSQEPAQDPIVIDIDSVIKERLPRQYPYIPRPLIKWVQRTVCQDQLNELLRVNAGLTGADFCRGVVDHLNIGVEVAGTGNLPDDPRVTIVSNHPLGGLDGMIYIDMVARHYGIEPRFVVNDLLMAVAPLRQVFLPVNKHGRQSRQSLEALDEAMKSDRPIIIFPAGLVSRRGKNGVIADLRWQKMFVNKCKEYHRPVIPSFFSGRNSSFFYNFAKLRAKSGLKFNIEMLYLPREMFRSRGSHFKITIGEPIPWHDLQAGAMAQATADNVRRTVYSLADGDQK
jgi:putative hemolysin